MRSYLGDGLTQWCPEPNADLAGSSLWNLYFYRTYGVERADLPAVLLYVPFRLRPAR
ncbi:hypothetical protein BH11ARM2_BH11ARM2_13110 [soil metagenome]